MKFTDVIGQAEAKRRLLQMVAEQRIPHAMMLCGPEGSGKLPLAFAFASYLLGERNDGESLLTNPDDIRNSEAMLANWEHPDLTFTYPVIKPKGASSTQKITSDDFASQWKQMLQQNVYFSFNQWLGYMDAENQQAVIYESESSRLMERLCLKSSQGGYKVSIIWLPERMNATCANKLLKLLEEPPSETVFLLVSEQPELLLETIRSRVQRFDVPAIETPEIEKALIERRGIDAEAAHRLARIANGSWLNALSALSTESEIPQFFDLFVVLMRKAYTRNVKELMEWSEAIADFGREKQKRMLDYFSRLIRENFMYNFRQTELCYMSEKEENFASNFARFINEANVIGFMELFEDARNKIIRNGNAKIVLFNMALHTIILLTKK